MILVTFWILLSAWLCATGWILSALHALNGFGYLLALAVTSAGGLLLKKHWWPAGGFRQPNWRKLRRRFQRPAPLIVLTIAALCLAAGLHSPQENGDTNAYRIPRVLHWLNESGWHWIRTEDSRQNIAGVGYEWLYAPLMLITRSDRVIFLPNLISYLLLPGIIFSFLRRMQVVSRVAWWWSWLLASGWCFTMQAWGTNNDALAAVYVLGAVDLALRARTSGRIGHLWLSLLAASLMTTVKPTNILLLLPCAVAVFPSWRLLFSRPVLAVWMIGFCVLASFVPTAVLNLHYTGSWKGYVPEPGPSIWWHWGSVQELPSPFSFWGVIRVLANGIYLLIQNLLPPFFPWASAWNASMDRFVQTPLGSHFAVFEHFGLLRRAPNGASAGIGLGVMMVALVSFAATVGWQRTTSLRKTFDVQFFLRWTPWLALLVFLAKVGTIETARLIDPFYALLFTPLLVRPGLEWLVRQRWWRRLVLLVMAATLAFMSFDCGRTFVPSSVYAWLQASHRPGFLKVLDDFYLTRLSVAAYWEFTARHSAGETVVGYATICGGLEPGMWRPWGHARAERILPDDSPEWVRSRGIRGVFIEDDALKVKHLTIQQWLEQFQATLVDEMSFTKDPGSPRAHLYFVRLALPGQPATPALPSAPLPN
jgi:hypothetical protein